MNNWMQKNENRSIPITLLKTQLQMDQGPQLRADIPNLIEGKSRVGLKSWERSEFPKQNTDKHNGL